MGSRHAGGPSAIPLSYDHESGNLSGVAYRDLLHDFNNDVGVAIGVLDAIADSNELSPALRRLAEAGIQRLIHARETLRTLGGYEA